MAYLPLEHKYLIQSSYIRFREISKELPEIRTKVTIGQFAHWGGLAVVLLSIVRPIIGRDELPDFVGAIALLSLFFGWAFKHDAKKKQRALWSEQERIRKAMAAIGVWFADSYGGDVAVYSGEIADGNSASPFHDGSYR